MKRTDTQQKSRQKSEVIQQRKQPDRKFFDKSGNVIDYSCSCVKIIFLIGKSLTEGFLKTFIYSFGSILRLEEDFYDSITNTLTQRFFYHHINFNLVTAEYFLSGNKTINCRFLRYHPDI